MTCEYDGECEKCQKSLKAITESIIDASNITIFINYLTFWNRT